MERGGEVNQRAVRGKKFRKGKTAGVLSTTSWTTLLNEVDGAWGVGTPGGVESPEGAEMRD